MQTRTDAGFTSIRTLLRRALQRARAHAERLRKLVGQPYRPEKHYMRGPGPKWREKTATAQRPSGASQRG